MSKHFKVLANQHRAFKILYTVYKSVFGVKENIGGNYCVFLLQGEMVEQFLNCSTICFRGRLMERFFLGVTSCLNDIFAAQVSRYAQHLAGPDMFGIADLIPIGAV